MWRGSPTGYAPEHGTNLGLRRDVCSAKETDRQCLVRLAAALPLDAAFGTNATLFDHECIAAVNGNTWASVFKPALLRGRQVLRVGGASAADGWVSSYEWFEPYLVDGVHYVRTDFDRLGDGLRRMTALPDGDKRRMRRLARRAAEGLFSDDGLRCATVVAVRAYARAQADALAWAKTQRWVPLDFGALDDGVGRLKNKGRYMVKKTQLGAKRLKVGETQKAERLRAGETTKAERLRAGETQRAERLRVGETQRAERLRAGETQKAERLRVGETQRAERLRAGDAARGAVGAQSPVSPLFSAPACRRDGQGVEAEGAAEAGRRRPRVRHELGPAGGALQGRAERQDVR